MPKDQALQLQQRGTGWGVMTMRDAVQGDLCSVAEHLQCVYIYKYYPVPGSLLTVEGVQCKDWSNS